MVAHIRQISENQHLRVALDWTVFALGVLSLTVAITATIVTHTADLQPASQPVTELATG